MSTNKLFSVFAAFIFATPVLAVDQLSYNYVEAGYETGEVDVLGVDIDTNAIAAVGSFAITDNLAITAGAASGEVETSDHGPVPDIDTRDLAVGLTPHFPIGDNVDLVIPVAIHRVRARAGNVSDSETGYSIGVGIRALVTQTIELAAGVQHVDVDDDEQSIFGSVRFHATESVSFAVGALFGDDVSSIGVSGRFSF